MLFRWEFVVCVLLTITLLGCDKKGTETTPASPSTRAESPKRSEDDIAGQLARGHQRLRDGEVTEAGRIANEILVREPNSAPAMVLAGQVALARGDVDGGVEMLDAAAEQWPEQSPTLYAQATGALWQANRLDEAQRRFVRLLAKHPSFDDARRGLATLLNRRGLRFDANQQIRVLCRRPGVQVTVDELRCLVVPSRAYYPFEEKPRIHDRQWIKSMGELNVARALFGEADMRDALTVLEASDVLKERHPAAVAFHGQLLFESQQFEAFEQWLSDVDKSSRRYPAYWMAVGGWALRRQQPGQAVRMFGEAILREPGEVAAHDRMHQALEALGDAAAAQRFEERRIQVRALVTMTGAILKNPSIGPQALEELAVLLELVGRPFEARGWRTLAAMKSGAGNEAFLVASRTLQRLLDTEDVGRLRAALLCNLDLSKFKIDLSALSTNRPAGPSKAPTGRDEIPAAAAPVFVNVAPKAGLDFRYVNADPPKDRFFLVHEGLGAGLACIDYDLDGRIDLYVGQSACNAPNQNGKLPNLLARNLGGAFETVTDDAGCDDRGSAFGVTAGDWNQDGFPDLVVGNVTTNRLLINQGDGTFREQSGDEVWRDGKNTTSLAIADVTGDHIPDLVEVNYLDDPGIYEPLQFGTDGIPLRFPAPHHFQASTDRIFVGLGDGSMRGQPLRTDSPSPGLGLIVTDIDGQVGNEIFVANDGKANHYWLRSAHAGAGAATFVDAAVARGVAYGPSGAPLACMGIAAADFDENGYLDLHITNLYNQWTNQYMQNEDNLFDDLALPFGLDESTLKVLGFGTEALDYDNNTTIDLVTGNGNIDDLSHEGSPFEMPTQLFIGDRSTLKLTSVGGDPLYWDSLHLTRGLVTLDWNGDGKTDFATTDLKEPLALLENQTETQNHWIQLRLVGKSCERDAIGAALTLQTVDGRRVVRVVQTGDGYVSRNEPVIALGLGKADRIQRIEIRWPDATSQVVEALGCDQQWLIIQGDSPYSMPRYR